MKGKQMRFIGDYEVAIPGYGVFGPGWEGPADKTLLDTTQLFEETTPNTGKQSKEDEN